MEMGGLRRLNQSVVGCLGPCIEQIFPDCRMKEERFLGHYTNLGGEGIEGYLSNVHPIQQDAAFLRIIKTGDQIGDRALASAAGTDQSSEPAGGNREGDVFQCRPIANRMRMPAGR